jgi:hypothetical protein
VDTNTLPSRWFAELDRDERNVVTALDIIEKEAQAQEREQRKQRGSRDGDERQTSG